MSNIFITQDVQNFITIKAIKYNEQTSLDEINKSSYQDCVIDLDNIKSIKKNLDGCYSIKTNYEKESYLVSEETYQSIVNKIK